MSTLNISGLSKNRLSLLNIKCLKESIAKIELLFFNDKLASEAAKYRAPKTIKNLKKQLLNAINKHNQEHPKNAV